MKNLTYRDGNLLIQPDIRIIGHQANTQNVFGSGIAASIRVEYPDAFRVDCISAKDRNNSLGNISYVLDIPRKSTPLSIFNLYGQPLTSNGYRQTNYEGLFSALEKMREVCKTQLSSNTVGFPYKMGSDRGGGHWEIVERLIQVAFDHYAGEVIICVFTPPVKTVKVW